MDFPRGSCSVAVAMGILMVAYIYKHWPWEWAARRAGGHCTQCGDQFRSSTMFPPRTGFPEVNHLVCGVCWSAYFAPQGVDWSCRAFSHGPNGFTNFSWRDTCLQCGLPRPFPPRRRPNWYCTTCGLLVPGHREFCLVCDALDVAKGHWVGRPL